MTYIHQNHLGSTSVTADSSGNSTGTIRYFLFGDCRNSTGTIPTYKKFTGQREASNIAHSIKPRVIFPMHYKTPKIDFPITGVDVFLKDKKNIRRLNTSEIEIKKETLPRETEIVVLQSAY